MPAILAQKVCEEHRLRRTTTVRRIPDVEWLAAVLHWTDSIARASLPPIAAWILVTGLDDLFLLAMWVAEMIRGGNREWDTALKQSGPERRIAIFIPLWREDAVIAEMIEHNIAAIRYRNYDIFAGVYPNDQATQEAVKNVADRFPNVHPCVCPHDGPTSKADCLNWIYQHMLLLEQGAGAGASFEVVVCHDAEDIMHPGELGWYNQLIGRYGMIQTPVLALRTRWQEFVHGLYCDDFAESHTKDMPARARMGGFVPSAGVGTAYSRAALQKLARADANRVFEPECLTEDYENGMRLNLLGEKQLFLQVKVVDGLPLATREYFPRSFRAALRQRTRWVTGIALQTWERHGWGSSPKQWYWLWRDRKGMLGNPISVYANVLFGYGLVTYLAAWWTGTRWRMGDTSHNMAPLVWATTALTVLQLSAKIACTGRVYGWGFGALAPLRLLVGNVLNSLATGNAIIRYAKARLRGMPLVWVKTEHSYPSLAGLTPHRRPLAEILVGAGYLEEGTLAWALTSKPAGMPLGEHLVRHDLLSEEHLVEALSLQSGMPAEEVDARKVQPHVARTLPARLQRERRVIAVRVHAGHLHVASPEVPDDAVLEALRQHTRLSVRFVLVTHGNFHRLCEQLL